jgi:ParB-like chromosome segregation protein Spo0J
VKVKIMSKHVNHPLAEVFPPLSEVELAALAADIKQHGLRESITTYRGAVLDGRNRMKACQTAGVEPRFVEYDGDDPVAFVISRNMFRRHLTVEQRALAAAKLTTMKGAGRPSRIAPTGAITQTEAAKLFGVSRGSVQAASVILDKGSPEIVVMVERGLTSLTAAETVARKLPKGEQVSAITSAQERESIAAANEIRRDRKATRKAEREADAEAKMAAAVASGSLSADLHHAPCVDALKGLDAGSVDWLITDPPYPRDYLAVYDDLARVAEHSLKDGGSLLCMVGQSFVPEIMSALTSRLKYHWVLAYMTPGGQAVQVWDRRVNTFWKPILWFTKGAYNGGWIGDVATSKANDNDKTKHHWGQSESGMLDLMRRFVKPGDTVLDPFMGGGTTGLVADHLGCRFIGYDNDQNSFNVGAARLADCKVAA